MALLIRSLAHYADIIAIPFWFLLSYYFYQIDYRTNLENFLLFGSVSAFVLDCLFTYIYFYVDKSKKSLF